MTTMGTLLADVTIAFADQAAAAPTKNLIDLRARILARKHPDGMDGWRLSAIEAELASRSAGILPQIDRAKAKTT